MLIFLMRPHLHESTVQRAVKTAVGKAGISKQINPHVAHLVTKRYDDPPYNLLITSLPAKAPILLVSLRDDGRAPPFLSSHSQSGINSQSPKSAPTIPVSQWGAGIGRPASGLS